LGAISVLAQKFYVCVEVHIDNLIKFTAKYLIKNSSKVQLFWNMQVFWAKKRRKNDGKDDFAFGFGHVFRFGGAAGEPFAGRQARHRGRHVG
jgi:hypothetical protein